MSAPRLLDLFSGAGGAAAGYARAGFEVTGVDVVAQPRYPFAFVQADALEYLAEYGRDFDVIHASPPCQAYSALARLPGQGNAPRLIEPLRRLLEEVGRPYAIENVVGAPLRSPLLLCGTMVGLLVIRHRLFEVRPELPLLLPPCSCRNGTITGRLMAHRVSGKVRAGRTRPPHHTEAERRAALGVDWMTARGARQAVPPAYTALLGAALLEVAR